MILAAIELAPYPPIEKPAEGEGIGAEGGGGEELSTMSEGGGAMATPAARLDISSVSSSSGC